MRKAHCLNTAAPQSSCSALIAARPVGPGIVLESVGPLKVAAVVVPTGGVAPGPPRVVPPLARPVCVPVLVVEALVLVVEILVLEVAVEPVVVVVEGLSVVTAVATVWLLSTKEAAKESCTRLILARSLPPSPSIAGATLTCGKEKPLLSVDILPSSA